MCNLYRLTKPNHEVAHLFDAIVGPVNDNSGNAGMGEVYPGRPGLVVATQAGGGKPGTLELRAMTWGFPLVLGAKQNRRSRDNGKDGRPLKPKPVNNARAGSAADPKGHRSTASYGATASPSAAA